MKKKRKASADVPGHGRGRQRRGGTSISQLPDVIVVLLFQFAAVDPYQWRQLGQVNQRFLRCSRTPETHEVSAAWGGALRTHTVMQ